MQGQRVAHPVRSWDLLSKIILTTLVAAAAGGAYEEIEERNVCGRYILGLLALQGQTFVPDEQNDAAAFLKSSTHGMIIECVSNELEEKGILRCR
jgi:hypothetical protein